MPLYLQSLQILKRLYKDGHPNTATVINNLADCLDALGRSDEALARRREALAMQRQLLANDSPDLASQLAQFGMALVKRGKPQTAAEAEPILRECLAIRQKTFAVENPEHWLVLNTMSVLGGSLVGETADTAMSAETREAKLHEAEPLLLDAYTKMKEDPNVPPPVAGADRRREAIERIVRLYEVWNNTQPGRGYDAKAKQWQAKLIATDTDI